MFIIEDNTVQEVALHVMEQYLAGQLGRLLIIVHLQKYVNGVNQLAQHVNVPQDHAVMVVSIDQVHIFVIIHILRGIDVRDQIVEIMQKLVTREDIVQEQALPVMGQLSGEIGNYMKIAAVASFVFQATLQLVNTNIALVLDIVVMENVMHNAEKAYGLVVVTVEFHLQTATP